MAVGREEGSGANRVEGYVRRRRLTADGRRQTARETERLLSVLSERERERYVREFPTAPPRPLGGVDAMMGWWCGSTGRGQGRCGGEGRMDAQLLSW